MILKGQLKPIVILLMILLIGCLMLIINSNPIQTTETTPPQSNDKNNIQLLAQDVFQVQYDQDGNKKTEIKSTSFTQYKSGIQSFTQPKFYLYESSADSSNTLNWEISSKSAQINKANILLLEEDVEGNRRNNGIFKFTTDWLNFDLTKNTANSDAEILIWQAQNTASATGFDMDLNTSKIDIQLHNNVKFHLLDETK